MDMEFNNDINYLIISEMLDGIISFEELINLIKKLKVLNYGKY